MATESNSPPSQWTAVDVKIPTRVELHPWVARPWVARVELHPWVARPSPHLGANH